MRDRWSRKESKDDAEDVNREALKEGVVQRKPPIEGPSVVVYVR